MKKIIRLIIKIMATPFFIPIMIGVIIAFNLIVLFDWLYEKSEWEVKFSKDMCKDANTFFIKWFTTI